MHRPVAETNDPLPPELNRTLDFWRCSSHCLLGSKLYLSFNCLMGGAVLSHIPSSPNARSLRPATSKQRQSRIFRIGHHNRVEVTDKLVRTAAHQRASAREPCRGARSRQERTTLTRRS